MDRVRIAFATATDRHSIYRMRHAVYAAELGQHTPNPEGRLSDPLDQFNLYIVAAIGDEILGFVSITEPGSPSFSVDKYFSRSELPFPFDARLYEVRLLTVPTHRRGRTLAGLLMYAAYRWIESRGGTRIVAIGRRELSDFYSKAGMKMLGRQVQSGAVTYELMTATISHLQGWVSRYSRSLDKLEHSIQWELGIPFIEDEQCFHGGAFFEAVGETFETLDRSTQVINADVLDAWFPPSPRVLSALQEHLPWLLRTSPPQNSKGLVETIAAVRGIPKNSIAVGAGSSSLIYLALREWLTPVSRVLLPDPTYGEYSHVFEQVIGCQTDRLRLSRGNGFSVDPGDLLSRVQKTRYDLVVLVNPNNPTGRHMPREVLESIISRTPHWTRLWIDEAYIDYVGRHESVETTAARKANVFVCKSLSKVYALSGARVAYLCGHPSHIRTLRRLTPPWAVSLPAQVAAVAALRDPEYYAVRYQETVVLRKALVSNLKRASPTIDVVDGEANYVLCSLPEQGPDAATVYERCREQDVFVRKIGDMSGVLGDRALRIAVKDASTNERIVAVLSEAIAGKT